MVRHSTPASAQAMVMRRTFSVPALWPARRGKPRRLAQRPLPSMMMPTWAGTVAGAARGDCSDWAARVTATLYLHYLGLLVPGDIVNAFHELVRQLLESFLGAALVFLRDATV